MARQAEIEEVIDWTGEIIRQIFESTWFVVFASVVISIYGMYYMTYVKPFVHLDQYKIDGGSWISGHRWMVNPQDILGNLGQRVNESRNRLARLHLGMGRFVLVTSDPGKKGLLANILTHVSYTSIPCYRQTKIFRNWLGNAYVYGAHRLPRWPTVMKIIDSYLKAFSDPKMKDHIRECMAKHTHKLLIELNAKSAGTATLDIYPYISRCTLDIMFETATGRELDDNDKLDREYMSSIRGLHRSTTRRMYSGRIAYCFYSIWDFFQQRLYFVRIDNRLFKIYQIQLGVSNRGKKKAGPAKETANKSKYLIDYALQENWQIRKDQRLTEYHFRDMMEYFIFRSHEPMTSAISFTLLVLSWFPHIQEAVFQEQVEALRPDETAPPTPNQLRLMTTLDKVMNETMRAYPPYPIIYRETYCDLRHYDKKIPKNTEVWLHMFAYLRQLNHRVQGFDETNFDSDRRKKPAEFIFGNYEQTTGIRCLGVKFAMVAMKVIISKVILRYKILQTCEQREIIPRAETVLRPKGGARVKLILREETDFVPKKKKRR